MDYKILIVEDDKALAEGLCRALTTGEAAARCCGSIREAREELAAGAYALMLLDINLPDGNGFDFLREIKETNDMPVILLTANDMETDIVAGLELGAEDYITKPFSLAVLRARVNTQLRRLSRDGTRGKVILDEYEFDFTRMEFYARGEKVDLSKTEQKLLRLLVENQGITLTRDTLLDRVWSDGAEYVDENALSVTIKRLRDKLHAGDYIKTIYGIGYTWRKRDG